MDEHAERRRYYRGNDEGSLSEAVLETVEAHRNASLGADEFPLYEHVNPEAVDELFDDAGDVAVSLQITLENVSVSIWNDDGVDIRVVDSVE